MKGSVLKSILWYAVYVLYLKRAFFVVFLGGGLLRRAIVELSYGGLFLLEGNMDGCLWGVFYEITCRQILMDLNQKSVYSGSVGVICRPEGFCEEIVYAFLPGSLMRGMKAIELTPLTSLVISLTAAQTAIVGKGLNN